MYWNPVFYEQHNQSVNLDDDILDHVNHLSTIPSEYGCSDQFAEMALGLMIQRGLHMPRSITEAFDLFVIIYGYL